MRSLLCWVKQAHYDHLTFSVNVRVKQGECLGETSALWLPDILSEFFDDPTESILCIIGHSICLIQDDELVTPENRISVVDKFQYQASSLVEDSPGGGKVEDLAPHYSNATVITCIQLQDLVRAGESSYFHTLQFLPWSWTAVESRSLWHMPR